MARTGADEQDDDTRQHAAAATVAALQSQQSAEGAASERGTQEGAGNDDDERDDGDDDDDDDDDEEDKNLFALHNLVEQGAIDALRALLPLKKARKGGSPPAGAEGGDEEEEEDDDELRRSMYVMANESLLLEKDDMGCLPIHIAIIYQRRECAMHLLRYSEALTSAMLRIKCADLNTPIVHLILRVGALNPDFATHLVAQLFNDAPSSAAAAGGADSETLAAGFSDDVKALLFEKMVAKDEEGNTVFHLCAMYDLSACLEIFAAFYARQAEQHQQQSSKDESSSGSSSKSKKLSTIKPLLEKANRVGFRPLHSAMKFHSEQVARQLVADFSVNVNSMTTLQQTPAHIAALAGFADGVALLLADSSSLVNLALEDSHGYTALQLAKRAKFYQVTRLLSSDSAAGNDDSRSEEEGSGSAVPTTKFFFHPESLRHLPMAYHRRGGDEPPPENPERIDTLVDPLFGILRSKEFVKEHVSWDYDIEHADIADVLRVHEYHYVDKIRKHCEQLAAGPAVGTDSADEYDDDEDRDECGKMFALDPDTALSLRSYEAATRAAGAVCKAVDQVVSGECTNAFCVVRPPGHHAGPVGKVVCENDPEGSHGFCLFNNVAIGAAYARSHYKKQGIHKIAILDFDVHHGNGTEEIVRQLVPQTQELRFETPYGEGRQIVHQYKPWRSEDDAENVFFCSVHGYGHKDPEHDHVHGAGPQAAWFYPGSGESDVKQAPLIWNVGLEFCKDGASASRLKWRAAFRDAILPQLLAFSPDLIFLSSGFDAHKKENVNWGYVSLLEQDYEWLVGHVKQVANACCSGRLVSVLEGGYNFHGRMVSPFARSVAAHARALVHPSQEHWDERDIAKEAAHERALLANYTTAGSAGAAGEPAVHTLHVVTSKKRSTDAGAGTAAVAQTASAAPMAVSRSKRARKDVDYVALAEEIAQSERK